MTQSRSLLPKGFKQIATIGATAGNYEYMDTRDRFDGSVYDGRMDGAEELSVTSR